jgi:hypothetical protein
MNRTTTMLFGMLLVFLMINGSTVVQAQGPPPEIERLINNKASELQLGKPLSQIRRADPPRRLSPKTEIWMQEFQNGRVYWIPVTGAVGIKGDILTRWLSDGGERGSGIPLSDEAPCNRDGQEGRAQLFEFTLAYWIASTREVLIVPSEPNEWLSLSWCSTPSRRTENSGRFQVNLTGFTVEQQTNDNIVETDGKGDEVFIVAEVAQYAHREGLNGRPRITLRRTLTSIVMGDANNQEVPRIRAGRAGENGGLLTGDNFPTNEPWRQVGTLSRNRLPMTVWEGELSEGLVIIVPTIWEWDDGNVRAREQYSRYIEDHFYVGTYQDRRLFIGAISATDAFGNGDRPIAFAGDPSSIRLDYPTATAAVQRSEKHGPGEFEIVYSGPTERYRLYYKIVRVR